MQDKERAVPKLCKESEPQLHVRSTRVNLEYARVIVKMLRETIANVTWGNCVGMAAPQIGINKRVFIAQGEVYINPTIIDRAGTIATEYEGCYSLGPGNSHLVGRPRTVLIVYQGYDGRTHTKVLHGKAARVVQHEYDHLEGILISDKGIR